MAAESLVTLRVLLSTVTLEVVGLPCHLVAPAHDLELTGLGDRLEAEVELHAEKWDAVSTEDVISLELLNNRRSPSGWLTPGAGADPEPLAELARGCLTCGEVLLCRRPHLDIVLLPRAPARHDGCGSFAVFLTNLQAVAHHASLLRRRQVAVVLDLDETVLQSSRVPKDKGDAAEPKQQQAADASSLAWTSLVADGGGKPLGVGHARLPEQEGERQGDLHLLSFGSRGQYRTELRPGWADLRSVLAQEPRRFEVSVCTHAKSFYMTAAYSALDPQRVLVPEAQWGKRLRSARPESEEDLPFKTPLFGLGVSELFDTTLDVRFGPVVILEDNEHVYEDHHQEHLLVIPAFLPSAEGYVPEDGSVLRGVGASLLAFHAHVYGQDGRAGGAADELLAEARVMAGKLQTYLDDPRHLYFFRAAMQMIGERCWEAMSLSAFTRRQAALPPRVAPTLSAASGQAPAERSAIPHKPAALPSVEQDAENPPQPSPGKRVLQPVAGWAPAAQP